MKDDVQLDSMNVSAQPVKGVFEDSLVPGSRWDSGAPLPAANTAALAVVPTTPVELGSLWRRRVPRRDGSLIVVRVLSLVGAANVNIEDTTTNRCSVTLVSSLRSRFVRVEAAPLGSPSVVFPVDQGTPPPFGPEVTKLREALVAARSPQTPITLVMWNVDPALADEFLGNNPSNRAPSPAVVARYARDLAFGNWPVSHQGLALGPNFELGDGAHRCLAVRRSGVTARMAILWYSTRADFEAARKSWDSCRRRTRSNVLELCGRVPAGQGPTTAAVLEALSWIDGRFMAQPTNDELLAMYDRLTTSMAVIAALNPREFLAPTRAAFVIAHRMAPDAIEECVHQVSSKIGYRQGSAAHTLVLKCPELQQGKASRSRVVLMKSVLALLHRHIARQPGAGFRKDAEAAARYFLGEHLRGTKR